MNKNKVLYIIRGLPGSGKSTLAKKITPVCFSADSYFVNNITGEYEFDKSKLREAHEWCYSAVRYCLNLGIEDVAVANTFTKQWEYEKYVELAKSYGYEPVVITVSSNFKSIHNVPEDTMKNMRDRFEYDPMEVLENGCS